MIMSLRRGVAFALTVCLGAEAHASPCACDDAPDDYDRYALTGNWGGQRSSLRDRGLILEATYVNDLFAVIEVEDRFLVGGLGTLTLDADLALLLDERLGSLHVVGFGIHGEGPSDQLLDVFGISGNTAPPDVRLFEAWIEQPLGPLSVRAGLIATDIEFTLAPHSTALINATFGITSQFSYNVLGPVYPVASPGVSATLELASLVARAAIYDGGLANTHGVPTGLDGSLAIAELELLGTFKLGAWRHSDRGDAVYVVVDRHFDPDAGGFLRAGSSPDQHVERYIDAGLRLGPWRDGDYTSAGVAYAMTPTGAELMTELTYQLRYRWLTVQPDLQILMQPDRTAWIMTLRTIVVL